MITDQNYSFASPAGREYIMAAARFAAVNPSSRVLDLGCGGGAGAVTLAREFRCKILAVDTRLGLADEARERCERDGVSHLVTIDDRDPFDTDHSEDPFDLVIAEGGFLKPSLRKTFFEKLPAWIVPRGWCAFADRIYTTEQLPSSVQMKFGDAGKHTLSETAYRDMITKSGIDLQFIGMASPCNWDNYYGYMAKKMADPGSYFGSDKIRSDLHGEINTFYRMDCLKYLGYLLCIGRKL